MNIYVDAGAYDGDTLNCKELFDFDADVVYAFEPNPKFKSKLNDWANNQDRFFFDAAIWTHTGTIEFAVDNTDTPLGSTVMSGKTKIWDGSPHRDVPCIDFSKWLVQNVDFGDVVIVKMDIEGAEFPVIEKLIKDETDKLITKLYVETHPNKVRDYTTTYKNELLSKLSCEVEEWH
jgi:FkbM family methyltransferase